MVDAPDDATSNAARRAPSTGPFNSPSMWSGHRSLWTAHCRRFVPASFWLLIGDPMTTLREAAFRHHGAHEFFIALSPHGAGPGLDHDALAGLLADEITMRRM